MFTAFSRITEVTDWTSGLRINPFARDERRRAEPLAKRLPERDWPPIDFG